MVVFVNLGDVRLPYGDHAGLILPLFLLIVPGQFSVLQAERVETRFNVHEISVALYRTGGTQC